MEITARRNEMSSLWKGVKLCRYLKKKKKENLDSKMFVDLYYQLAHRCHLHLIGGGGGSSDWSVYCQERRVNWSKRLPKGRKSVSRVYTH